MIKLIKSEIPNILRVNGPEWTRIVLQKQAESLELTASEKSRYAHPEIKAAIIQETNGKCAYCESKVRHIAYGDIEHVIPKSSEPELWFDWENLTLACDVCNTNKGNKRGVVDPYAVDPEQRFVFLGSVVWPVPGDETAALSVRILDLNRTELVGKRLERIEYLMLFSTTIEKTTCPDLRAILEQDFKRELESDKEYAALCRAVARELTARGVVSVA
ncbi:MULTISPECIES: HNH endonuclease [unclassified Pseudomonas]|uniref:HNH endonuclease n=1 Tax=unclassified Pseudomonas TaxID=196821 RepID=UPI001CC0534B|nr:MULTISPECIES: HNH endonuclease [unclassified Pseudomonas]